MKLSSFHFIPEIFDLNNVLTEIFDKNDKKIRSQISSGKILLR